MQQYPPGYGYPYGQPIPDPTIAMLVQQLQQMQQLWAMATKKNEQEYIREEAYSEVIQMANQLWVPDKRGNMRILLDVGFDNVYYIQLDKLYGKENFFAIAIHNIPDYVIISERDFYKPSILLNVIARASGMKLRLYKSERQTSELLRQHISSRATELFAPFYLGWHKYSTGWTFELLDKSTHGHRFLTPPTPSRYKGSQKVSTPTIALVSTEQILLLFDVIANAGIKCSVILWFHAAALTSLISGLDYRIPMGLCFFTKSLAVRRYLEAIFAWYGDSTITLATQSKRFVDLLVARKDQPLLLSDCIGQKSNSELVRNAIQSGEIPLSMDQNSTYPELSSLPTLISDDVTMLSISSYFATLEICDEDLVPCSNARLTGLNEYITEYVQAFTGFVAGHIDDLKRYLSEGLDEVVGNSSARYDVLTPEGTTTLGILFGVRRILSAYYRSLAANPELEARMLRSIYPTNQETFVTALLTAAECRINAEDMVSFFFTNLNRMIKQECFDSRSTCDAKIHLPCTEGKAGIVYSDETCISLTRRAFVAVCRACGLSGPALLRELSAADVLLGSRVNKETNQTRITVYDAAGQSQVVYVYKFDRQSIYDYTI